MTCVESPGEPQLAQLVSHVTLEPGVPVEVDASHWKIWRVRNTSATAWPPNVILKHTGGDLINATKTVPVQPANPGEFTEIALEIVPKEQRRHVGYWRMSAGGVQFGPTLTIDVVGIPQ
eukprot:TRINITY_DN1259_c0_g2_i2.p3 TRINITY_DN1259_c0_g2~~TRINITY_DN1259_c0_g2_i2.p3  ORF type:complete len:119 (-),score=18.06 TRINITY_DN1259_c0_g2_i2:79-435(-)